ncbi:pimeloyl-ACP methyl ester carboxylesterase/DNA-binding CsgD family transcriptional regulator [Parvibaculum sp. MBR-TMA-1.3b-4.2]
MDVADKEAGNRESGAGEPNIVDGVEAAAADMNFSAVVDAVYTYASDPYHWEEMTRFLRQIELGEEQPDMAASVENIRSHLERAQEIAGRLHGEQAEDDVSRSYAYLVFGRNRRVLARSRGAEVFLAPYAAQGVSPGARLSFSMPENEARLGEVIGQLKSTADGLPLLFRLYDEAGDESVVGYAVPEANLPRGLRDTISLPMEERDGAIAIIAPEPDPPARRNHVFRRALGLSRAEARLASHLQEGLSLKEASEDLGVTVNTARNQLKSIFEKLGINRQSDLVRHLTQLSQLSAYIRFGTEEEAKIAGFGTAIHDVPHRFVELNDGRRIAYRVYGRLNGTPVVLMQSSLRSSLVWHREAQSAAELGVRLIVIERPGTGYSTADPEMTFESAARDVEEWADKIGLEKFSLLTRSSSAPFGLAVAARMGSRIVKYMMVAPRFGAPEGEPGRRGMLGYFFSNLRRYPWVLDSTLFILRAKMSRRFMRPLVFSFFEQSPRDIAYLEDEPDLVEDMIDAVMESVALTYSGLLRESALFLEGVNIDLTGLSAPLHIWHGEEDRIVPLAELRRRIDEMKLELAEFRTIAGEGHAVVSRLHREVLEALVGDDAG